MRVGSPVGRPVIAAGTLTARARAVKRRRLKANGNAQAVEQKPAADTF